MKQQRRNEVTLPDLHDDLVEVFCFLPIEDLLTSINFVSKQFRNVLNNLISEVRWRKIYLGNFGFEINPNPPVNNPGFKELCFQKFREYMISKNFQEGNDTLMSRIRTVSRKIPDKDNKEINHGQYMSQKDTLRKSIISLRVYAPTQEWEEITIEDLCCIQGSLDEPETFEGTLKMFGKDGFIFQIEYGEGQVFLKEHSCERLVGQYLGMDGNSIEKESKVKKEDEIEEIEEEGEEEDDDDEDGELTWLKEFFRIIGIGLRFDHVQPLIREFEMSPYDAIFVPDEDEIEELFPMQEED